MKYYFMAFRKYFRLNDRSSREEYWYFMLINFIFNLFIIFMTSFVFIGHDELTHFGLLLLITYNLATALPTLSITIRRLHDTGRRDWYLLLVIIPYIGAIYVLYLLALPSQKFNNKYGYFIEPSVNKEQ
jgi:uncharacterized membrane protein YhaH (DUF805 family)